MITYICTLSWWLSKGYLSSKLWSVFCKVVDGEVQSMIFRPRHSKLLNYRWTETNILDWMNS